MANLRKTVGGNFVENLEGRRLLTVGASYAVPAAPRIDINQNAGWKYAYNPTGTPQATTFNDSSWAGVTLPHTWNNVDPPNMNFVAGNGWYRKTINIDASLSGKKLYLDFEGGLLVTSLFIDGTQVDYKPSNGTSLDPHNGGFQEFLYDVTSRLTPGSHLIAVRVNNQTVSTVAPAGTGDYSKVGGLYRDVSLVALPNTRVTRVENVAHAGLTGADSVTPISTPGVYFTHTPVVVGAANTTVNVKTVLDNSGTSNETVIATSYLVDADGIVRTQQSTGHTLAAGATGATVQHSQALSNPRLWNGRIDPYLYDLYVEIRNASTNALIDLQHQRVGIRSFTINANAANASNVAPFLLNGERYTLVGSNAHQDTARRNANNQPAGWAQSDAMIQADIDVMMEQGSTVVRTAHYQHNQAFYDYCDKVGLLVFTEGPINGTINDNDAFRINAQDQFQELVRQTYNNPSVFAWGFGNETNNTTHGRNLFIAMNNIAHTLDPARKTAFAQFGGSTSSATNMEGVSDIKGTHRYDYWYGGAAGLAGIQNTLNAYPSQPLAITEYGGGGSAYQFADNIPLPVSSQPDGVASRYHPSNRQVMINMLQTTQYEPANFLWARIVWQGFDHLSRGKDEGDQRFINDKGMITRDRVLKDSYHYYAAIWNDPTRSYANKKVLKIASENWTVRNSPTTKVTVFSNLGAPTLSLNGTSLGVMSPLSVSTVDGQRNVTNVYEMTVTLPVGQNTLTATRLYADGQTYTSSNVARYYNASSFALSTPVVSGVAVNRTFAYDPDYKTTSNPFNYALPNGVYDVKIVSPTGGVNNLAIEGQTAAIDSNGNLTADTFYARVQVSDGQLTLAAGSGAYNAAVTSLDVRAVDSTAPAVATTVVNGGAAQRSAINSIGVTFTEPVTLTPAALSLGLRNVTGTGYAATFPLTASNPSNDGVTYIFSLASGASLSTLTDGLYDLNVGASGVSDLSGNAMATGFSYAFHRLLADADGNRIVNFNDFLGLQAAFGKAFGQTGFSAAHDFDDDDDVDFNDFLTLQAQFGKRV